jgi:hypothetical protein
MDNAGMPVYNVKRYGTTAGILSNISYHVALQGNQINRREFCGLNVARLGNYFFQPISSALTMKADLW